MTKIKHCGITNVADARYAIASGADFLGLIFVSGSLRSVSPQQASSVLKDVGSEVKTVAVFRNSEPDYVNDLTEKLPVDFVQLHGSESPGYCRTMSKPVIKVIEIEEDTEALAERVAAYKDCCQYILFDKPKQLQFDGWLDMALSKIAASAAILPPYFFAGGLTADSATTVLDRIDPFALDVASGTESEPGKKDAQKLSDFCQAVKSHPKLKHEVSQ